MSKKFTYVLVFKDDDSGNDDGVLNEQEMTEDQARTQNGIIAENKYVSRRWVKKTGVPLTSTKGGEGGLQTFIIGYHSDTNVTEELMQFKSKEDAEWFSEEWCEVKAKTLQEAFDKYEESFLKWRGEQSKLFSKKEGGLHTQGEWKTGSYLPGDEYKCCILNDEGRLLAQTFVNPYFSTEAAEANAELIVKAVNNHQQYEDYIEYVDAKIEIGEVPLHFVQWRELNNLPHF